MPSTSGEKPNLQVTIDLSELDTLRQKAIDLEGQVAELRAENDALKKWIDDAADPARQAAYKAFRKKMGYA